MNYNVKKVFDDVAGLDSFRRVSATHPINLYLGKDSSARKTLLLISDSEPEQISSSKLISIYVSLRSDDKWYLSFSLCDENYIEVFCNFCEDIISSSEDIKEQNRGTVFICNRYTEWQDLLKNGGKGLLGFSEIKGLVGELYFLKNFMFNKYTIETAVDSWTGPDKADQDFIAPEIWYEIKTTVSGASNVAVSSVEQLDSLKEGELVVINLDKTSRTDENRITLNSIVKELLEIIPDGSARRKFGDILLKQRYTFNREYDEFVFKFSGMTRYRIDKSTSVMRKRSIPLSVSDVKYRLSLSALEEYIKEE